MARPHPALVELAARRSPPSSSLGDWDALLRSAVEHRMTGLLWSRVRTGELECPPPWKAQLAGEDVLVRARHRRLWDVLGAVTRELSLLGVEAAVIKGVPAEARWYDRVGERPCRDIDLLLAPTDVPRVPDVLDALHPGHELRTSFPELWEAGLVQSLDLNVAGVGVDLHVDLFRLGPPARHPERLWRRTTAMPLPDGGAVRVLDAELSLVHFLLHLNRDSFSWLLGFADIARILGREELDWDAIDAIVADEGIDASVWGGLAAVAETLGVRAPTREPQGWRGRLWRIVWRPAVRLQGDEGWVRHRHRLYWLPVVSRVGMMRALQWEGRQLSLSPRLVAHTHSDFRGPWWWRLARGRVERAVGRRMDVRRLRAAARG